MVFDLGISGKDVLSGAYGQAGAQNASAFSNAYNQRQNDTLALQNQNKFYQAQQNLGQSDPFKSNPFLQMMAYQLSPKMSPSDASLRGLAYGSNNSDIGNMMSPFNGATQDRIAVQNLTQTINPATGKPYSVPEAIQANNQQKSYMHNYYTPTASGEPLGQTFPSPLPQGQQPQQPQPQNMPPQQPQLRQPSPLQQRQIMASGGQPPLGNLPNSGINAPQMATDNTIDSLDPLQQAFDNNAQSAKPYSQYVSPELDSILQNPSNLEGNPNKLAMANPNLSVKRILDLQQEGTKNKNDLEKSANAASDYVNNSVPFLDQIRQDILKGDLKTGRGQDLAVSAKSLMDSIFGQNSLSVDQLKGLDSQNKLEVQKSIDFMGQLKSDVAGTGQFRTAETPYLAGKILELKEPELKNAYITALMSEKAERTNTLAQAQLDYTNAIGDTSLPLQTKNGEKVASSFNDVRNQITKSFPPIGIAVAQKITSTYDPSKSWDDYNNVQKAAFTKNAIDAKDLKSIAGGSDWIKNPKMEGLIIKAPDGTYLRNNGANPPTPLDVR